MCHSRLNMREPSIVLEYWHVVTFIIHFELYVTMCNHWSTFADNAKRLLTEMTAHGYSRNALLKQLDGFWLTFAEQQLAVFQLTVRNPKQLWLRVMKVCREL